MRPLSILSFSAFALVLAGFSNPAKAIDWASSYPMDNCPNAYGCVSATVQTINCHEISVRLYWPDRATRYVRVENDYTRKQRYAFPYNQSIDTRIPAVQPGWNLVHIWTVESPERDVDGVVWVPSCNADNDPNT